MSVAATLLIAAGLGPDIACCAGTSTVSRGGIIANTVVVTGRMGAGSITCLPTVPLLTITLARLHSTGTMARAGRCGATFALNITVGACPTGGTLAGTISSFTRIANTIYTCTYLVTKWAVCLGVGARSTLPHDELYIARLATIWKRTDTRTRRYITISIRWTAAYLTQM